MVSSRLWLGLTTFCLVATYIGDANASLVRSETNGEVRFIKASGRTRPHPNHETNIVSKNTDTSDGSTNEEHQDLVRNLELSEPVANVLPIADRDESQTVKRKISMRRRKLKFRGGLRKGSRKKTSGDVSDGQGISRRSKKIKLRTTNDQHKKRARSENDGEADTVGVGDTEQDDDHSRQKKNVKKFKLHSKMANGRWSRFYKSRKQHDKGKTEESNAGCKNGNKCPTKNKGRWSNHLKRWHHHKSNTHSGGHDGDDADDENDDVANKNDGHDYDKMKNLSKRRKWGILFMKKKASTGGDDDDDDDDDDDNGGDKSKWDLKKAKKMWHQKKMGWKNKQKGSEVDDTDEEKGKDDDKWTRMRWGSFRSMKSRHGKQNGSDEKEGHTKKRHKHYRKRNKSWHRSHSGRHTNTKGREDDDDEDDDVDDGDDDCDDCDDSHNGNRKHHRRSRGRRNGIFHVLFRG